MSGLHRKVQAIVSALGGSDRGLLLQALVKSGSIEPQRLTVKFDCEAIAQHLDLKPDNIRPDALELAGAFTLRRRGVEARIILSDASPGVDKTLLKNVGQGWAWFEEIKAGATMREIANRENLCQRRIARLIDLAFLAPDIVQAIVDGRQPATLTSDDIIKSPHKTSWADQRTWLATL